MKGKSPPYTSRVALNLNDQIQGPGDRAGRTAKVATMSTINP